MKLDLILKFASVAIAVFALSVILERIIIPILKSHKIGQHVSEIGPRWHMSKDGTPTMGGICFIMAILAVLAVVAVIYAVNHDTVRLIPLAMTLALAVANGMIGFFDDFRKLVKKQNEGLKWYQKLGLQIVAAAVYLLVMDITGNIDTTLYIPFFNVEFELGIVYYLIAMLLICGIVNSVNLTDGVDGLASCVTFVVGGFFAVVAFSLENISLIYVSAAVIGGTLGFLVYNAHPAKVFMGDTGSLFWGGMVVGAAFMINNPLIILVCGFVYVCEAASDIIQIGCYKLTHKRVFKMAPIHHHFEKCGWSENKIVLIFSLVTVAFSVLAWFGI